jgi:hypothetical protein
MARRKEQTKLNAQFDRVELDREARRWGAADWCTGGRLAECPYTAGASAELWREAFAQRESEATRFEMFIARFARVMRTKIF